MGFVVLEEEAEAEDVVMLRLARGRAAEVAR